MDQIELIDKRKPREKHFLQKDGTIIAEIYNTDIHYLKDGKYEEIDNTLIKEKDYYVNKSNDYKVKFNKDINKSLMKMSKDNHYIDFKLKDNNKLKKSMRKLSANNITYSDIADNIKVEYQTLSNKVKETIVLQDSNYDELSFNLDTNLNLELLDGEIISKDENGNTIFKIEKPFMFDSNNIRNDNIYYLIDKKENYYELKLVLDDEWLKDKDRVYPVYVDPTINSNNSELNFRDTFICSGEPNVSHGNLGYLVAGVDKVNSVERINRTLIKFDLPVIGTGYEISEAILNLIPCSGSQNTSEIDEHLVEVYRVTSDWNENQANWNNMHDKYDSRVEYQTPTKRSILLDGKLIGYPIGMDITGMVKKWYEEVPNYGLMIKACDESYTNDRYPMFYSSNNTIKGNPAPVVIIKYRNQNGIENYWDYKKQVFSDGIGLVNTHTGNLTTVFDIGNTIGGVLPASLSLVYNTNDVVLGNKTFFGNGYRLNMEQVIEKIDDSFQYLDEDGTIHYFYKNRKDVITDDTELDKLYYDEDGLGLTIEDLDVELKMLDLNNTEMIFTKKDLKYYLTQIRDINGNSISITYNSDNSISKIIDKYNQEINIQYDTNNIQIVSSDNKIVKLNYNNSKLSSIESVSGITAITYNENNVISAIVDVTGLKTKYEYYEKIPYKIKKINEIGNNDVLGKTLTFKYSLYETSIIYNKGIIEVVAYNEYGNAISRSILKGENQINDAYSAEKSYDDKNQLTSDMITNKYVKNILKNTSFEEDDILFGTEEGVNIAFDLNNVHSGLRSLKVETDSSHKSIEQSVSVPKGKFYTFSCFIKSNISAKIILSYTNSENQAVYSYDLFEPSDEFERQDVTLFYSEDAISNLIIKIELNESGILYLDDIQLEEGEVANYYNIIENSDFKDGLIGWGYGAKKNGVDVSADDYISIEDVNENIKALKIKMEYNLGTSIGRKFNIRGNEGDTYTLSFWYKNKSTNPYAPDVGSSITIFYEPYNSEFEYCIVSRMLPVTNGDSWQHFVYTEKSIEDFKSIRILFNNYSSANDFQVTNISLYKDVTREEYGYDSSNNLVSIVDQSNNKSNLKYDNNNQLTRITNTLGESTKYEYDVNKKNQLLSSISPSGLVSSNLYKDGNLVKNKVSKKYVNDIVDGIYKVRQKGTYKYIKAELNMVLLEESDCSNTLWFFEKHGGKYKIKYNTNRMFSISYRDGQIVLDNVDNNNLFYLEKSIDDSYVLKYDDITSEGTTVRYLSAVENDLLELNSYSSEASNIHFYIELPEKLFIENDINYTDDKKFKSNEIDSTFRKTIYESDNLTGNIKKITNPKGIVSEYKYNNKNQCTSIKYGDLEVKYVYGNNNQLSNIIQGNKNYSFNYNEFMNTSSIVLNNIILSSMEYESNNGLIKKTKYGNNQEVEIKYDEFNRASRLIKEDDVFKYYYDTNGNVSKIISNNSLTKAFYDSNNRIHSYFKDDFKVKYLYDSENLITSKKYKYKDYTNSQINSFDSEKLLSTSLDNILINYSYDDINRNIGKNINNIVTTSSEFISNGKRTSNIIKRFQINSDIYSYEYDELLNIRNIYLNNNLIKEYEYDDYNELTRERNYDLNLEVDYSYDTCGNIKKKILKSITDNIIIDTINYAYGNTNWEDQLTSYNNIPITYDNIGNMISFNNNNYIWKNGNELASITNNVNGKNITYKYDTNGIRTLKVCNSFTTKYFVLGDEIVYEDRNGTIIYYLYDVDGLIGFKYNNEVYYYLKNLQNDIIGILDRNGNKLVSYIYDSWGKIVHIKDGNNNEISNNQEHIANINPFRYRSYYYDEETNLYYLNHRYYNPELGRFISPDIVLGANSDILSYNLYAYVSNNPISNYDRTGNGKAWNAIVSFVSNLVSSVKNAIAKKSNSKKKNNKSSSVAGVSKSKPQINKPTGPMSVTADITVNAKETVSSGKNSTTTQYINKNGISYDKNYGAWGYDISGPTSADIYLSATFGKTTFKYMYGVDGDYFYNAFDIEKNIDKESSVDLSIRNNVRKDFFAFECAAIGIVTLGYVLSPVAASVIAVAKGFIDVIGQVSSEPAYVPIW